MSEIDELRQLVAQHRREMQTQNAVMKALCDANQKIVSDLLARGCAPPAVVVVPEAGAAAATRATADARAKLDSVQVREDDTIDGEMISVHSLQEQPVSQSQWYGAS